MSGCISTEIVQPENLQSDATRDIVVRTRNGKTIRMLGGDYQITTVGEVHNLKGKGDLFLNEKHTKTKRFEGEIPLDDVSSIETREKTVFYYSVPILMGTVVLLTILFAIAMGGRGFGG